MSSTDQHAPPSLLTMMRHGETDGNRALKHYFDTLRASEMRGDAKPKGDASLLTERIANYSGLNWSRTEVAKQNSQASGQWIKQKHPKRFDYYVTSGLLRAIESAEDLGLRPKAKHGKKWHIDMNLRERDWGAFHTLPELFKTLEPQFADHLEIDPGGARPPGGESLFDLQVRVQRFLNGLRQNHSGEHVMAVSHLEFIRMAFAEVVGMPVEASVRFFKLPANEMHYNHIFMARAEPDLAVAGSGYTHVRRVCPVVEGTDTGWVAIEPQKAFSDAELSQLSRDIRHEFRHPDM